MSKNKAPTVRLEIKHTNPEKDAERLAVKLAEAYNNASLFDRQAFDYKQQAAEERRKGTEIQSILLRLNDWREQLKKDQENGVERNISRMEPMLSYDERALEQELSKYKEDANKFQKMSDDFKNSATAARRDTATIQLDLKEAHKAKTA